MTDKPEKRSQASQLVDMAKEDYILGVGDDSQPYGSYPDAPHIALPLRGGKLGLRNTLAREYFRKEDTVPSSQALTDACNVIEALAAETTPRTLHLRVAAITGRNYIDMCDRGDRVIEISQGSWRITDSAPVVFRRSELSAALPEPVPDGDITKLWSHVNIVEADRPVLLAVLLSALIQTDVSHVILGLIAEHGCAKTTTAKRLVALTDPSAAPLSGPPRDVERWAHTAYASWVVTIDNVSTIPQWWSDALCRAATGDAMTKRRLYTDAGLSVLQLRRCVILTGIDLGGLSGDLTDRLAFVELRRLSEDDRNDEKALDANWKRDYPSIFGGLLDLAAQVQQRLSTIELDKLPRMADFGKLLSCVDEQLKTQGMARYRERSTRLIADSLVSDSFIAELMARNYSCELLPSREIRAEMAALMAKSDDDKPSRRPADWPKDARAITTRLARHAPGLRAQGWLIDDDGGRNIQNTIKWTITPPPQPETVKEGAKSDSSSSSGSSQPKTVEPASETRQTSDDFGSSRSAGELDESRESGFEPSSTTDDGLF